LTIDGNCQFATELKRDKKYFIDDEVFACFITLMLMTSVIQQHHQYGDDFFRTTDLKGVECRSERGVSNDLQGASVCFAAASI
jgi:hypothetical protein